MDTRFTFTKDKLDSLPLPEAGKRATYHDAKVPGLQVRVTANGAKSFSVFKRLPGGQPERVTLGKYPHTTIEQARKQALEKLHQLASGTSQKKPKTEVKEEIPPTLAEAVKEYTEKKKRDDGLPLKESTRKDYLDMVKEGRPWKTKPGKSADGELYPLAGQRIDTITGNDIRELHEKLEARCTAATGNTARAGRRATYAMTVLQGVLRWHGVTIPGDPFGHDIRGKDRILLPKTNSGANPIPPERIGDWWHAVSEQDTPVSRYLRFTLLTGCRPGEPLGLLVSDCDLKGQRVVLRDTKTRENATLFLSEQAAAIVRQQAIGKAPGDPLFDVTTYAVKRTTKALGVATGIVFSPKSLRSTFGNIAETLTTAYVLKNLMRHSMGNDITGQHYIVKGEKELRPGAQKIADWIEAEAAKTGDTPLSEPA